MEQLAVGQRAFAWWLRTGRLPIVRGDDGLELRFNPYHDPHDGRFTSGPGGADSSEEDSGNGGSKGMATPTEPSAEPAVQRGGNSRAFEDPMTLEQAFPGLAGSPAGMTFAVADDVLNFTGPANEMTIELLKDRSGQLIAQIKAIDPNWHYDEIVPTDGLGHPIKTVEGLQRKVNDLRFQRAAFIARVQGDYGPLQVETTRFMQRSADAAYDEGKKTIDSRSPYAASFQSGGVGQLRGSTDPHGSSKTIQQLGYRFRGSRPGTGKPSRKRHVRNRSDISPTRRKGEGCRL